MRSFSPLLILLCAASALSAPVTPNATRTVELQRLDVDQNGSGIGHCSNVGLSSDGRYVVFLAPAGTFGGPNVGMASVYLKDRTLQTYEHVSVTSDEQAISQIGDHTPQVSPDGRYVTFESSDPTVAPGVVGLTRPGLFLRDRITGETELLAVEGWAGSFTNTGELLYSELPEGGYRRVVALKLTTRQKQIISLTWDGKLPNGPCFEGVASDDGRLVAFTSQATNLTPNGVGSAGVVVRDRLQGTTEAASVSVSGASALGVALHPSISADGRFVAFESYAYNLVPEDTNGTWDTFVRDRQLGATTRLGISTAGKEAKEGSHAPLISADGTRVLFFSRAGSLAVGDTNGKPDLFIRNLTEGVTRRVTLTPDGAQSSEGPTSYAMNAEGTLVVTTSDATDIGPAPQSPGGLYAYHLGVAPPLQWGVLEAKSPRIGALRVSATPSRVLTRIRNTSRKPVRARLLPPQPPFYLDGDGEFELGPRESFSFYITFDPTSAGVFKSRYVIQAGDKRKVVKLQARGVP